IRSRTGPEQGFGRENVPTSKPGGRNRNGEVIPPIFVLVVGVGGDDQVSETTSHRNSSAPPNANALLPAHAGSSADHDKAQPRGRSAAANLFGSIIYGVPFAVARRSSRNTASVLNRRKPRVSPLLHLLDFRVRRQARWV